MSSLRQTHMVLSGHICVILGMRVLELIVYMYRLQLIIKMSAH